MNDQDALNRIHQRGELLCSERGQSIYRIAHPEGDVVVRTFAGASHVYYQLYALGDHITPSLWDVAAAGDFCRRFLDRHPLGVRIQSARRYGEPKLAKPMELKGHRQDFSVRFREKCKCPCFVCGDDVWIQHRDFFSEAWKAPAEDEGRSQEYCLTKYFGYGDRRKFVYGDNYSSIILRNEAWLVVMNLVPFLDRGKPEHGYRLLVKDFSALMRLEQLDYTWNEFWRQVVYQTAEMLENKDNVATVREGAERRDSING